MYLVFSGSVYYASGGARDLSCTTDSLDSAIDKAKDCIFNGHPDSEWAHVYDTELEKIVWRQGEAYAN